MKEDARTLSTQAQEEKRKQAIRLHKKGLRYKEIATLKEERDFLKKATAYFAKTDK